MSYSPLAIMTDCGDGRGVALVQDGKGPVQRVGVDLNEKDGTPKPRIQVDGDWVEVGPDFAKAYKGLVSKETFAKGERERLCGDLKSESDAEKSDGHWGPGWMVIPAGAAGLSYVIDRLAFNDLRLTLPNDRLTDGVLVARTGTDLVRTISYVGFEPHLSDTNAAIADAGYGAVAVGMGIAAVVKPNGGDPELRFALSGVVDISAARLHRHTNRGWGSLYQVGLGAVLIPVGALAIGLDRPAVSEHDMYAPSGMAGARDVNNNPYESTKFPNLGLNLATIGLTQFATGAIYGISYLATGSSPGPSVPQVSALPRPEGGGEIHVMGRF